MLWFGIKKEVKKSFDKIKESFKSRDKEISENKKDIVSNKEKIAKLEGIVSVLLIKSQSQKVSHNLKQSQETFETRIINKVRRSKKAIVMAEMSKLAPSMSTIEMYEEIVLNKGICSKASFYRYVTSLKKSQEVRLKQ